MIETKDDLRFYLRADLLSCGMEKAGLSDEIRNPVITFQKLLRITEYYTNFASCPVKGLLYRYYWFRLQRLRVKLGFTIPLNVFGPGLSIAHYGAIVVNKRAKIGCNCRIHPGVCVGGRVGESPVIGDNVYIGPGAKVFGSIRIGDNTAIGANAVVTKDIPANVTVAGAPAKVINEQGSAGLVLAGSDLVGEKRIDWRSLYPAEVLADMVFDSPEQS